MTDDTNPPVGATVFARIDSGTAHRIVCNGNQDEPIGGDGCICNPHRSELAKLRALAVEAKGGVKGPRTEAVWAWQIIDRLAAHATPNQWLPAPVRHHGRPPMTDDTNPPVGATVVDGYGNTWTREEQADGPNEQPEPGWWRPCTFGYRCAEGDKDVDLTALWRLQQERDELRAENAALRGVIRGAANAGVQVDEPRLTWVELQMERDDWQALVDAARGDA